MAISKRIKKVEERIEFKEGEYRLNLTINYDRREWTISCPHGGDYIFRNTINLPAALAISKLIATASKLAFDRLGVTEKEVKARKNSMPF